MDMVAEKYDDFMIRLENQKKMRYDVTQGEAQLKEKLRKSDKEIIELSLFTND